MPEIKSEQDSLDIHDPAFVADPYPAYERLRGDCPVMHSDLYSVEGQKPGFWLLTRYEDVKKAALDWKTFTSSVPGVTAIPTITHRTQPQLPLELDPPVHSKYRSLLNPLFSKARVEELRPRIQAIVSGLVVALLERGGGDLVAEYAIPLSMGALGAFTDLPGEDSPLWLRWMQRMFNVHDRADSAKATEEFGEYIDDLIERRRRDPNADFFSLLVGSEIDGHKLTNGEIHSFGTMIFGAGFETTQDGLSVMLYHLAEHPEARRALIANPALIPSAVEEYLRFVTPIQIFCRNARHEVEMRGRRIPEMEVVALSFGSANHDPQVFSEPEQIVLDRAPNPHLAFGAGIHLCLGAPVARLEMALTLQEFSKRIPDFTVVEDPQIGWKPRGDRRGIAKLPVVIG